MKIQMVNRQSNLCFIGLLIIHLVFSFSPVNAAQLIDSIPVKLTENWRVCLHFESQQTQCVNETLPQKAAKLPANLMHQSYSKDFVISSELKRFPLGIWIRYLDDVDKVMVNGELIGKTGQFLPNYQTGFRQQRLYFIPTELLKYNQFNRIEIVTYSSRNQPGIKFKAPIIGDYIKIQHKLQESDYSYVIVASMLMLLTIFPLFYFIAVKGNYETLYFLLFLFGFAVFSLARSQIPNHTGLDLNSIFKLETFMLNGAVVGATLFIFNFFELEIRKFYTAGLYILGLAALFIVVWPNTVQLRLLAEINYWLLVTITFFVIGSALVIALHKQRKYALTLSITCIAGWLILVYDATMQSSHLFDLDLMMRARVIPIFSAIVAVIFVLSLTHKYWHYFKGSTYDHLTGTLLRPAFFQRLSEEMQRCNRREAQLLVAVIDIQQAKKISMNYGYSIGNHLLTAVSNSLTKVLRPYDLICRFSDEQFCIAASITDRQSAEICMQRIYEELINIQQPINKEIELYVDARIGGAIYNDELHLSVSHIIQDANYALSKAKSQSKQNYLLEQTPLSIATA